MLTKVFIEPITDNGSIELPARLSHNIRCWIMTMHQLDECLVVSPSIRWFHQQNLLRSLPEDDGQIHRMISLRANLASLVELDGGGCITIPQRHRELADLGHEAIVVGRTETIEIWNRERWANKRLLVTKQFEADFGPLEWINPEHSRQLRPEDPARVLAIPASSELISILGTESSCLEGMGPEELELFVCDRFERMGFRCARIGSARAPDGGIDLIACPNETAPFPFLLAIQVKSHRPGRNTGVAAVRDFMGTISSQPVSGGVIVTNTNFSMNARWFAERQKHLIQLRDFDDLSRWIRDDFATREFWREVPDVLQLRPGMSIRVRDVF